MLSAQFRNVHAHLLEPYSGDLGAIGSAASNNAVAEAPTGNEPNADDKATKRAAQRSAQDSNMLPSSSSKSNQNDSLDQEAGSSTSHTVNLLYRISKRYTELDHMK